MNNYSNDVKEKLRTIIKKMEEIIFIKNYLNILDMILQPHQHLHIFSRGARYYRHKNFTNTFEDFKTFHGYRLLAVDGSKINITYNTESQDTYFKSNHDGREYNMLNLNALYDLCNKLYINVTIQPIRKLNETEALIDMVDRAEIPDKVIVIADRGYESYNAFAHIQEKGWKYVIRVKKKNGKIIVSTLSLPSSGEFDIKANLTLTRKQTNEVKSNPKIYKILPNNWRFDHFN